MTSTQSRSAHRASPATPAPRPPAPTPLAERRSRVWGHWRHDRLTGGWEWPEETTALLGLPAAGAGTAELLAVLHPDDRPRAVDALSAAVTGARAFSLEVRVRGREPGFRSVLLLGEPQLDDEGRVVGVEGLAAAVPRPAGGDRVAALEAEVAQLHTAMAGRAPIEQAKGVLMLLTGCGEQTAFDLLAHISSHTHRKVREVALDLVASATGHQPLSAEVRGILRDACPPADTAR